MADVWNTPKVEEIEKKKKRRTKDCDMRIQNSISPFFQARKNNEQAASSESHSASHYRFDDGE